jgi:hypothetical protein
MGWRPEGSSLYYRRSDLRHLDGFAAAILLSGRWANIVIVVGRPQQIRNYWTSLKAGVDWTMIAETLNRGYHASGQASARTEDRA